MKILLFLLLLISPLSANDLFLTFLYGSEVDYEMEQFIKENGIKNVLLFQWANELSSRDQVKTLTDGLRKIIKDPIIAVDQEGGRVARLQNGFTKIPPAAEIDSDAYAYGKILGIELKNVGINLNLAPVVDVNSNPDNPVIGDRSFGETPQKVSATARQMIQGMHKGGVAVTLKHFPGHGDTSEDSHHQLPVVNRSIEQLSKVELLPFQNLHSITDAIMTAHVLYPALDPNEPATFSKPILTSILRENFGFEGVIISDSLVMGAVTADVKTLQEAIDRIKQRAVDAFLAGCDLLTLGRIPMATEADNREMIRQVLSYFNEQIKNGTIPQERVHDSIRRINKLKKQSLRYAHRPT